MNDRLTSDRSCNLDQFTSLIHATLKAAWGADWGTFCEAFPNGRDPQNIPLPAITYLPLTKRPGIAGSRGTREIKPRFRQAINVDDNTMVSIYAQVFDYEIQFDMWEQSNDKLNKLADQFEDFMMTYAGYFKKEGVGEVVFDRMYNQAGASWRENLLNHSYVYLVRIEKQIVVPENVIKEVIAKVEIYKDLSDGSDGSITDDPPDESITVDIK